MADPLPSEIPVSVMLERRLVGSGRWTAPQWELVEVIAGAGLESKCRQRTLVADVDGVQRFLWRGLDIELFKDGAEGYWYNLLSDIPYLFVVCMTDEDDDAREIEPVLVTVNQDEAMAHMESDDLVLSAPMPPEICDRVERFVVANYEPKVKSKRKRRDWADESAYHRRGLR